MKMQTETQCPTGCCCTDDAEAAGGMRRIHRIDQVVGLILLPFVLAVLAVLFPIVLAAQGRPFIYRSERMRGPDEAFWLYKIRTMHPPDPTTDQSVLGGDLSGRVTRVGAILRKSRLDELPQILNVLRGDIRFIGPRPPLRKYVDAYPDLYARVLGDTPPGITGLATVMLHAREERLLSACRTAEETDRVYRTHCIPVKARLDLLYRRRRGAALNTLILFRTLTGLSVRGLLPRRVRRAAARRDVITTRSRLPVEA